MLIRIIQLLLVTLLSFSFYQTNANVVTANDPYGPVQGTSDYGVSSASSLVGGTVDSMTQDATSTSSSSQQNSSNSSSGPQKVITSEKVPGATCTCKGPADLNGNCTGTVETRKYECIVPTGLTGFENVFKEIVRTVVYIVMILGVLAIVGLGIAWAWAGGDDVKMKSNLKHWAFNVIIGLVILFMFRYILTFLAPWIFQ